MSGKIRIVLDYDGDGTAMWVTQRSVDFDAGNADAWVATVLHDAETVFDAAAEMFGVPRQKWEELSRGERIES